MDNEEKVYDWYTPSESGTEENIPETENSFLKVFVWIVVTTVLLGIVINAIIGLFGAF